MSLGVAFGGLRGSYKAPPAPPLNGAGYCELGVDGADDQCWGGAG